MELFCAWSLPRRGGGRTWPCILLPPDRGPANLPVYRGPGRSYDRADAGGRRTHTHPRCALPTGRSRRDRRDPVRRLPRTGPARPAPARRPGADVLRRRRRHRPARRHAIRRRSRRHPARHARPHARRVGAADRLRMGRRVRPGRGRAGPGARRRRGPAPVVVEPAPDAVRGGIATRGVRAVPRPPPTTCPGGRPASPQCTTSRSGAPTATPTPARRT
jgi:hypothetical protein